MTGSPQLGDFGLQAGSGWAMFLVRVGTLSRWGHACVCVSAPTEDGRVQIVEAMPDGVRMRLSGPGEWTWSNVTLSEAQRAVIVGTALDEVGKPYDWGSILGFILRHFGAHLRGGSKDHPDQRLICSELVAWAYQQAGADMFPNIAPGDVSPGDLAQYLVEH